MRRRNDMLDSIGSSHLAHLKANVPGAWTVVHIGEEMAVYVDHPWHYRPRHHAAGAPAHVRFLPETKRPSPKRRPVVMLVIKVCLSPGLNHRRCSRFPRREWR